MVDGSVPGVLLAALYGTVMNTELPGVDKGKQVLLTSDASGAKQPGTVLAKADLPKLQPSVTAPPSSSETPQAKGGSTSQQMHQSQPQQGGAAEQPGK